VTRPDNRGPSSPWCSAGSSPGSAATARIQNDERLARASRAEALEGERSWCWPELVYIELICMVALTAVLILWAIRVAGRRWKTSQPGEDAEPVQSAVVFRGAAELLVYFDPVAGRRRPAHADHRRLCAIPYLDCNRPVAATTPSPERRFAYVVFQFGFLVLWITLIILGTFLRVPSGPFFGPFETWDAHKTEALYNVSLAQYFWIHLLASARPVAAEGAGLGTRLLTILLREAPGIVLLGLYFVVLPASCWRGAVALFRGLSQNVGRARYVLLMELLLLMRCCRSRCRPLDVNLTYFVSIPEYFLNF